MKRFSRLAALEGGTLLLLLLVAVPLKHLTDYPGLVRLLGPVHGLAFLAYMYALWSLVWEGRMSLRLAGWGALSAFVPFGSWYFVRRLKPCIS